LQKNLNREDYVKVLWAVGSSAKPLNRYQIREKVNGDNYVYEIVTNLCPSGFKKNYYKNDADFLTTQYSDNINELIAKSGKEARIASLEIPQLFPHTRNVIDDVKNWRLALNFRGLLLFFSASSKLLINREFRRATINKRIYDVLSNQRTTEIAPFLWNWKQFEEIGFDVIRASLFLGEELESQLDSRIWYLDFDSETYLLKRATEIYFNRVLAYLYNVIENDSGLSYLLYRNGNADTLRKIKSISREYKLNMIKFLKISCRKEIHAIERLENYLINQKKTN